MSSPDKSRSNLMELKARVSSVETLRKKLESMGARYVGTYHQVDTYFYVPKGRLKLRQVEGTKETQLIYYEREDVAEPKRSRVFILEVQQLAILQTFLGTFLKKRAVVDKQREIYDYKGTKVHLDKVKNLGAFIEFERKTGSSTKGANRDRKALEELMQILEIRLEDLVKGSYGDMILAD